jgi:aminopeptidase N
MNRALCIGFFLLFLPVLSPGQKQSAWTPEGEKALISTEMQRFAGRALSSTGSVGSEWLDVTYYGLNLTITTSPNFLEGRVLIRGTCKADSAQVLQLDLKQNMQIDSIVMSGGVHPGFLQESESFTVWLDSVYLLNEEISMEVFYRGTPAGSGFGSFAFSSHASTPWIWSLSEPYGARDWWPCKDNPNDKADSADIVVTCDSIHRVGSNGRLLSVTGNGNGTATHHWSERYPISPYLISIAITNYASFSNWFRYSPTDSMEILNYVLPEHLDAAQAALPKTVGMLEIFSDLYGLYPFINEKYGHSDFGWGGAMEHQTMTSTTTYEEGTIAHELAHQWFGDMITCRTWPDIWMNEGFAQYSTALYLERAYGTSSYWGYMNSQMASARVAPGTIYVYDTSVVRNLFNGALVYAKGASVLHMLRHLLGDSTFFLAMKNYANAPDLRYANAATADFQRVCEATSGRDLDFFFTGWIYGEKYPRYTYSWKVDDSAGVSTVRVHLIQTTGTTNPSFFTMPVDLRLYAPGWDSTVVVWNDAQDQTFAIQSAHRVDSVMVDPDRWILRDVSRSTLIVERHDPLPDGFNLRQNYPNPFNGTTEIRFSVPSAGDIDVTVYNMLGEEIATLYRGRIFAGEYTARWDASTFASGTYMCIARLEGAVRTAKIMLIK